jgi:signal transduction histidine kinase
MADPADKTPRAGPHGPGRASHLGFVAHEVRNPLSTALWTAELLARLPPEERGGARGERLVAICLRSVLRMRFLIEDHFLAERLDAGGYPLRAEALSLDGALEEAMARRPSPVPVERAGEAGLRVLADRALLVRVLEALVAVAAVEVPAVTVTVSQGPRQVEVRVSGAAPGSLEDPGKGAASEPRGHALALPMARRAAATFGGSLAVDGGAYILSIPPA